MPALLWVFNMFLHIKLWSKLLFSYTVAPYFNESTMSNRDLVRISNSKKTSFPGKANEGVKIDTDRRGEIGTENSISSTEEQKPFC